MFRIHSASVLSLALVLTACGGGGEGSGSDAAAGGNGNVVGGNSASPAGSDNTGSDKTFSANVVEAPADGATVNGFVDLEVRGNNLENVELLPQEGYVPRLGTFSISPDKTVARLNFDTKNVPNGPLQLRIGAFSAPTGSTNASEITAMPTRSWTFNNAPAPFGSQEGRAAKCQAQGKRYTSIDDTLPVVCIERTPTAQPLSYEQCTAAGYSFETGFSNPQDGLPVTRDGALINKFYCTPPAINGTVNPGCACHQ